MVLVGAFPRPTEHHERRSGAVVAPQAGDVPLRVPRRGLPGTLRVRMVAATVRVPARLADLRSRQAPCAWDGALHASAPSEGHDAQAAAVDID